MNHESQITNHAAEFSMIHTLYSIFLRLKGAL